MALAFVRAGPAQTVIDIDMTMLAARDGMANIIDGVDQLPAAARPVRAAVFAIELAPLGGLRIVLDPGADQIVEKRLAGSVTNAALSRAQIVATETWAHA